MPRHYDRYPDLSERCKTAKTKTELARYYDVSVPSIAYALKKRNLQLGESFYSTLAADYAAGATTYELAQKYGVSQTAVCRAMQRRGIPRRSKAKRDQRGSKNSNWLGDNASYFGMHKRVRKARGKPQHCEKCDRQDAQTKYHWANLTKNFSDPNDYIRLCVSCHAKHDNWGERLNPANDLLEQH